MRAQLQNCRITMVPLSVSIKRSVFSQFHYYHKAPKARYKLRQHKEINLAIIVGDFLCSIFSNSQETGIQRKDN